MMTAETMTDFPYSIYCRSCGMDYNAASLPHCCDACGSRDILVDDGGAELDQMAAHEADAWWEG